MTDVFVSYASRDRDRVAPLVRAIERRGWSVWWDRAIGAGSAFDREIERAIDEARCIVVVWSEASVESDWVRTEATEGLDRGVLVPVAIDDVRPPLAFRRTQTIALQSPDASLEPLLDAIRQFAPAHGHTADEQSPLVGRSDALRDFEDALQRAREGRGGLLLACGEAGVGKSRLVREAMRKAGELEIFVLSGQCLDRDGAPPYQPLIQQIEEAVRVVDQDVLRAALGDNAPEMARLMPELRQLYPDISEPIALPPDQERRYVLHGCGEFLARAAAGRPMLLVFEDLHWAGESTCVLLLHLAHRLRDAAVLLAGTYRDNDLNSTRPFARTLQELLRERLATEIRLKRLDEAAVADLLEARSGQHPPAQLVQLIFTETEGNPFFVEEVYRHLEESGRLFDGDGRFRQAFSVADNEVPRSVRLIIEQRLENTTPACRKLLTAAAVVGRRIEFRSLAQICQLDEDDLLDSLEEAVQANLLEDVSRRREAAYQFVHEQIRQTLLGLLSVPRRQRMHLRVAEALEADYGNQAEAHAGELAWHLYQAGAGADEARTAHYLMLAAERALTALAFEEALGQLDMATELLDGDPGADRVGLERMRARALRGAARPDDALEALARALARCPAGRERAELLRERGQLLVDLYRGGQALPDAQELKALAQDLDDADMALTAQRLEADAYYSLSLDQPEQARPALEACERTIDMARAQGHQRLLARSLIGSAQFLDYWDDFRPTAKRHLTEARRITEALGDEDLILDGETMSLRASLFIELDYDVDAEGTRARLEARRDPLRLKEHLFWMIPATRERGQLQRSVEICDQAIGLAARLDVPPVQYPTFKAIGLFALGRFDAGHTAVTGEVADAEHRFGAALQRQGFLQHAACIGDLDAVAADAVPLILEAQALNRGWMVNAIGSIAARALGESRPAAVLALQDALAAAGGMRSAILHTEAQRLRGEVERACERAERMRATRWEGGWRFTSMEAGEVLLRCLADLERWQTILELTQADLRFCDSAQARNIAWRLHAWTSRAHSALGHPEPARQAAARCLTIMDAIAGELAAPKHRELFFDQPLAQTIRSLAAQGA